MKTVLNEPIAKTSGLPLKEHNQNLLKQAADALSLRAFVIEKYKKLTNGADLKAELETSAKWHDIGKTDNEWQDACQADFKIWESLGKPKLFRAKNIMATGVKGFRHEIASLQIAQENNYQLSPQVKAAIAAHHGKLSRRYEERWKYRPIFQKFWSEFNNQSAEFPLNDKKSFDKIISKRFQFDGVRAFLQLIDHRASAKENGDELPEFRTFDYKFPYKDELGNDKKNEVQKKIEELWDEPFAILRAPTGAGKTDAALLWAKHQVDNNRADRLVIAMPTRFTANALSISVTEENFKNLGDAGLYHSSALYQRLKDKDFASKKEEWEVKKFVDKEQDLARTLETPLTVTTIDHLCICLTGTRETHHATFFGLANSCVVIDEADFYDEFTQLNIVVLLRALRLLNVPVLLMSATVPDSAIELYRQSGFEIDKIHADESDYERTRCTITRYKDAELPEEIEDLLQRALNGEPTIIYANTVSRAQNYYYWFKRKIDESYGEINLEKDDIVIYHSRFIEPHKVEKENRLRELLGRKAWENGTQRGVAILTQIGEISVNISANLMISDLCPLDRLAQRVGRLARFTKEVGELFIVKPMKTNKDGETKIYPAPYGEYRKKEGWQMSDTLEKSDELLTGGDYSAKTFVDKVNNLYPNLKQAGSHTLENQKIFRNLITANWLILPQYTDETKNAEDSDEPIMNWRSRDIPFQYTIFTGFNPNFIDFDNDEDGYQPPTNKAELREFEARYGISCYAYEYHKAKKAGKIDSVENGKPLIFDIKGETITREFVSPNYYDKDTGLNFADDNFGEDDS
jgi:CRISPR-associated endonuclease/helicase Cas3